MQRTQVVTLLGRQQSTRNDYESKRPGDEAGQDFTAAARKAIVESLSPDPRIFIKTIAQRGAE